MTKLQLRRAWFQVHKWIGLALAVLIIPLCLTGSALVWHDTLDRLVNPARYATSGSAMLAPDRYAAAAQAALGGQGRIATLAMPKRPGDPVVVSSGAQPTRVQGPSPRTNVYLDPPTARVLQVANSRSGATMVIHMIHGSFMLPGVGRAIVGWVGVAMLVSSISGLWLWWPVVGSVRRGFRWKRQPNLDANLHHLFGFWISLPLFVLSLTGAWISFPAFFGPLVGENGRPMGFGPDRAAMNRAQPLAHTHLTLADALARASSLNAQPLQQVGWPNDYKPAWQVVVGTGEGKPQTIAVDDASGTATRAPDMNRGQAGVARLMRRIHDGDDMGPVWQAIIFLGGLLPAVLAVTGIIMWWRARRWRRDLATRRAAA